MHIGPGFNRPDIYWPRLADLKVKTFRADMLWAWLEKEQGQLLFDDIGPTSPLGYTVGLYRDAKARGITPILVLGYGNKFYDGGNFPTSDAAQAAFVRYAVYVAKYFKGYVTHYEIWNEWNIGMGVYPRSKGDPVVYARLLKKVYAALKLVDPQIVVIGGAAAGQDLAWARSISLAGASSAMDAYSVHPYNLAGVPEQVMEFLSNLETTLKSSAGREVPIHVTEVGWSTFLGAEGVTASTAADYLARYYLLAPFHSFLKGTNWYDFSDDSTDLTNVHMNFGLHYYGSWAPKPAACAMGDVNGLINAYRPVSASRDARGVWTAKYTNGTNFLFAVWTEEPGATVAGIVSSSSPTGATINGRGVCRTAAIVGNGSTLLRAPISNSPTIFTTIASNLAIQ